MIDTQKIRERSIVPGSHQIPVIQMLCDEVDYLRLKNKEITDLDEARERIRELEAENERLYEYIRVEIGDDVFKEVFPEHALEQKP